VTENYHCYLYFHSP